MKKKPTRAELAKMEPRKRAAVIFYQRHRTRLLKNANDYYAGHRDDVLAKAKVRYANKRPDYFCAICHVELPRTVSGHHLFCESCWPICRKRNTHKGCLSIVQLLEKYPPQTKTAKLLAKKVAKKLKDDAKRAEEAKKAAAKRAALKAAQKEALQAEKAAKKALKAAKKVAPKAAKKAAK